MNGEISKYTISVYELIENGFDFGLDKYTIFDENYRKILNDAILNYYMFREIGFANPTVWRQKLVARMDLIMRNKYNAMYKAKLMDFNPLYTMELYEDYTHTINNNAENTNSGEINFNTNSTINSTNEQNTNATSEENSNTDNEQLSLTSQFPSEEMTEDDLTDNVFVDGATKNKASEESTDNTTQSSMTNGNSLTTNNGIDKTINTNNGTSKTNTSETFSKKTIGSASDLTFAHAMVQFGEYLDDFQIDQQVIGELKDLFIQLW